MKLHNIIVFSFLTALSICLCGNTIVQTNVAVPHLVGMTVADAKIILHNKSLDIGAIIFQSGDDSENFDEQFIIKQYPPYSNKKGGQNYIRKGQVIDLWIADKPLNADTLKNPYIKQRLR